MLQDQGVMLTKEVQWCMISKIKEAKGVQSQKGKGSTGKKELQWNLCKQLLCLKINSDYCSLVQKLVAESSCSSLFF